MKRLLHIIATPRAEQSRTLAVSRVFLEAFRLQNPGCAIDELNVATEPLPPLTVKMITGKYTLLSGGELTDRLKEAWEPIRKHAERFLAAEGYLISTPMWNFGIPYTLKHYIDLIIQPKLLFRFTPQGVERAAQHRKMVVISTRGGDYGPGSAEREMDQLEPSLRTMFGFIGIQDITFISAQPMDAGEEEVRQQALERAMAEARRAAAAFQN